MMVSTLSKYSKSWVNGPTHEIHDQRVPGYTGFIPGVHAENVFSSTYSRNTAKSLAGKITRGQDLSPNKRFLTVNMKKFNDKANRRITERPQMASQRDYLEYTMTVNKDNRN